MQALRICKQADLAVGKSSDEQRVLDIRRFLAKGQDNEASAKGRQMACLVHVVQQNQSLKRYVLG